MPSHKDVPGVALACCMQPGVSFHVFFSLDSITRGSDRRAGSSRMPPSWLARRITARHDGEAWSDSKSCPRHEREGDRAQALERVIHGEGMGHETQRAQCLSSLAPLEGGGVPPPLFQIVASRRRVPFGFGAVHSHCATSLY